MHLSIFSSTVCLWRRHRKPLTFSLNPYFLPDRQVVQLRQCLLLKPDGRRDSRQDCAHKLLNLTAAGAHPADAGT